MRGGRLWAALLVGALGCGDDADAGMDAGPRELRDYGRDAGRCGDGVLDRGEQCDGTVLAQSCESLGLKPGPLSCSDDCTLDRSRCGTRPPSPFPDGGSGFFPDAGPVSFDVQVACQQILNCGQVPLPQAEDGLFEAFGARDTREFCERNLDVTCMDCNLASVLDPDLDAGGDSCQADCRSACWGLSLPRVDSLFLTERCPATATAFVKRYDPACLCGPCVFALHSCLTHPLCHEALLCIDATGCEGDACADAEVCRGPIRALSFSSSSAVLDELRTCVADNACQAP